MLRSPSVDWQITSDGQQETATAVVQPREGAAIPPGTALRHRQSVRGHSQRSRAARSRWRTLIGLGRHAQAARGRGCTRP
ncbi:trehalase-like domain-containing protein [Actinosynnema sp. NPDC023658]|uniref:trehalase-like domain-containing protein n=1 Tax=Actinosynnema sp. NPDC023658 TaxID=3155465 RepID=UPI00340CED90